MWRRLRSTVNGQRLPDGAGIHSTVQCCRCRSPAWHSFLKRHPFLFIADVLVSDFNDCLLAAYRHTLQPQAAFSREAKRERSSNVLEGQGANKLLTYLPKVPKVRIYLAALSSSLWGAEIESGPSKAGTEPSIRGCDFEKFSEMAEMVGSRSVVPSTYLFRGCQDTQEDHGLPFRLHQGRGQPVYHKGHFLSDLRLVHRRRPAPRL